MKSMESSKNPYNQYYSLQKKVISFIGQWPYQDRRTRWFRLSLMTATIISLIVPQVGKFIQCDKDLQCIMSTIPTLVIIIISLALLYTFHFNNSKIKSLIEYLCDDWEKLKSVRNEEHKIMKKYAANARLLSLACCLFYYILDVIIVLLSCLLPKILDVVLPLNETRPMITPFEVYYFVDSDKYFFYIYLHILISTQVTTMLVLSFDCMLLIYIDHACSVFAVAGFRFEALSRNYQCEMNNSQDDMCDRKVAISVYAHWRALRFVELVEETFRVSLAIQLVILILMMSVTLLQITMKKNVTEVTKFIACIFSELFHLFCYSIQGQRLIDHSMQVRDKIYNSFWYNVPVKSQRLLLYVMQRSIKPKFMSAGKIFIFSRQSFTTILQSTLSYFTVFASI